MLDSFLAFHYSTATFVGGFPFGGRRIFTTEEQQPAHHVMNNYVITTSTDTVRKNSHSTEALRKKSTITESLILAQDECWRRV